MAEKEIYRLDIVIGVTGDEEAQKKLSAMDKYVEQTEKRAKILDKINATPAVKINDKATKQMEKVNSTLNKLNKAAATPTVAINDQATKQLEKINGTINRLDKMKPTVTAAIFDRISRPVNKIKGGLNKLNNARVLVKANVIDRVSGPTKTILSGLGKLKNTAWSATVTIKDKVSPGLSMIRNGISKTIAAATSLQGVLLGVGGTWAGVIKPMQISGDFEQTQMAFTTMLHSADKANSFLAQAQDMANATPFEFPQLADASKKMLGFGWNVKQILPDLKTVGDTASGLGLGAEGINQITLALGQMKAKGRVQGDEILQLTEAGIPAAKILQEQLGLTADQVANIGNQGIDADKAVRALLTGMDKRFGGMMQDQSKTDLGLMSTLKDTFENKLMNPWGQGLWSGIKPGLTKVTDWLNKNDKKVTELGNLFKKAGENVSSFIGGNLEKAQQKLSKLMDGDQWKNADLGGKIKLAWNEIIAEPFSNWWNGSGRPKINKIAGEMGSSIGGTLRDGIITFLDALGGNNTKDKGVDGAGTSAGTTFTNAFLEAFDTGKIVDKLISSFANANINAAKDPSGSNFAKAGIMDYILFGVLGGGALLKGGFKLGKTVFKGGKALFKGGGKLFNWFKHGSAAGKAAEAAGTAGAAAEVAGAGAKAAESVSGISKIAKGATKFFSGAGKLIKGIPIVGRVLPLLGTGLDIATSSDKARTTSELAGNIAGSSIGGKIGGTIGSALGPIGTGIGYLAGSGIGWYLGGKASTGLYDKFKANSATDTASSDFSKSLNGNADTVKTLDKTQSGLIVQSNAYRGTLSGLLSATGLASDSQGRLTDASGQYQGSLGELFTSTGLVMDSQGNLLDANSLVQDSQVNLALSMDNLSQTVGNLNGNMGGLGDQKKESAWDKIKGFFGGNSETTSVSGQQTLKDSIKNNNLKNNNSMAEVYSLFPKVPQHANGTITNGPEFSLIGEAGTEAVIPLSSARRNRGLQLWQQAGRMLGVRMFADGGIVGSGSTGTSKVAKATANISTSIALEDNALSQFKQYGNKVNDNLSSGILENRKVSTDSVNRVSKESGSILHLFSKTGHVYGGATMSDFAQGISAATSDVTGAVKTLTNKVIEEFKSGFGIHSPSRVFYKLAQYLPQGFINGLTSQNMGAFIKHWIGDITSIAGGAMSGNISEWLTAALRITGTPMNWLPGLLRLVQAESGGNPSSINSQAVGGEHATGLLQTLPSTFREYAASGMGNILNPVHNAAAAINYIKARYGSVFNTPLFKGGTYVGYASGTDNAKKGLARINERGWEFVDFTGGENVLNHTKSVSLMEKAANSLNRVRSAVSGLGINNTERDIPEGSSNPGYYTSQQMAMAGASYGDIHVDVENNFNDSTDVDGIVEKATVQFARQLKAALLNKKR